MTRRFIWVAVPILLVVIFFQTAYFPQSAAKTATGSESTTGLAVLTILAALVPQVLYSFFRSARRGRATIKGDPTADIVLSGSVLDLIPLAVAAIGGMIGAYLLLSQDAPPAMAWLMASGALLLAAFSALVVLTSLLSGPFRLSLSAAGLDYGPFKCGPIAWRDIRRVELRRAFSTELISIEVADPGKYFARGFPKIGRNPGRYAKGWSSPFVISPKQIHISPDRLLDAIRARIAAFGSASDSKGTV